MSLMKERNKKMTALELIERLQEYKPSTKAHISTDQIDPVGGACKIFGMGEIKNMSEDIDGVYILGF